MIKEFCDRCNIEVPFSIFSNDKVVFKITNNGNSITLCAKCYETFNHVFMTNAFITTGKDCYKYEFDRPDPEMRGRTDPSGFKLKIKPDELPDIL
jgi:hypothetical protein